jgi:peptidoglycan/xylan/chitin deacetylase (PgdA/CDA1 family)
MKELVLFLLLFLLLPPDPAPSSEKDTQGATVRINTNRKVIYLIFSADEAFEGAEPILASLDRHRAKASFFLTGNCLREKKFESVIQTIIQRGHYVGGHSDNHLLYASWDDRQQPLVTPDSLMADLRRNWAELEKFGIDSLQAHYFLPPYEYYNKEQVRLIESMGQTVINYTPGLRTAADYTTPDMPNYRSSQELIDQLFAYEAEKGLNGCIVLIHPGTQPVRTDKLYLRLDEIIRRLQGAGYALERL